MRGGVVAAVLVGVLGLTGVACGGPPAGAPTTVEEAAGDGATEPITFTKDPCTLLTEQEITAALGQPAPGKPADFLGQPACEWRTSPKSESYDLQLRYSDPGFIDFHKSLIADPESGGS